MQLCALFRLAFASAPDLQSLTSLHNVTRRSVLQKVRDRTFNVLSLLVNTGFQVLFHSPPGVLFTFPSRYYSLSVIWSYLALRDGPRAFRQDSSCPDVLRIPLSRFWISPTGLSPSSICLSRQFGYPSACHVAVLTPRVFLLPVWAAPISLATTFGIVFTFFSSGYLDVSVPRVPFVKLFCSFNDTVTLLTVSSLIRISTDHYLFAVPRSFSQLVASFFGAMYLGILLYALCSLIFLSLNCFRNPSNFLSLA